MLSWKYSQIFLRIHIIVNIGEKLSWTMPPDVYLFPCCPRREEVLNVTTQKRKSVLFVDNWGIRYRKQHKHWKVHTYSWHVMNWWCCLIVEQPTLSSCPECVTFASYATEETYWKLSYRGNILHIHWVFMSGNMPCFREGCAVFIEFQCLHISTCFQIIRLVRFNLVGGHYVNKLINPKSPWHQLILPRTNLKSDNKEQMFKNIFLNIHNSHTKV